MSGGAGRLTLDVTVPLSRFALSVRWEPDARALGVFGHSGAGKTTLLETVAGLRPDARGLIRVGGRTWLDTSRGIRVPPEDRGVGYVPQDALLFPHRDVIGNLMAGRRRASSSPRRLDPARVLRVLELEAIRGRAIASLSGGERQRVALGRALCSGPELLLFDEPLAGLDVPLRRRILPYLVRVRDEFDIPTLHVSHDATETRVLADEVLVLEAGRVVRSGPSETVFTDPMVLPIARAEGFENVLRARVIGSEEGTAVAEIEPGVAIRIPLHATAAREVVLAIRAEDLILSVRRPEGLSAQNVLAGVVKELRDPEPDAERGEPLLALVDLGHAAARMVVAITEQARRQLGLAPGSHVHVIFKTQACRLLAARENAGYNRAIP